MKRILSIIILTLLSGYLFSQNSSDSIVLFSDLKFHSEFEKNALLNFVIQKKGTFNLFLAIDENINAEIAQNDFHKYNEVIDELREKKIESKPINKQIKLAYSSIHSRFLDKYSEVEYFPEIFQTGIYNCVSASMIYALAFDNLKIPYKVMAASNHVYLIANPGEKSVVIETTNPGFEKMIFTGEFKQQYVDYLRNSKLISESDIRNKSVEEIFEEKFNEVKNAEFGNLPGFQYYNKALTKLQNNDTDEAFELCQKAYFFYPDQQVKVLLYNTLVFQIQYCNFDNVNDIDYLAQLSRFENTDQDLIIALFSKVINDNLQYTNREKFCDSVYHRLVTQISNQKTKDEISFSYFMLMSYQFQNTKKVEYYVTNALDIKGNFQDANIIFKNYIEKKLNNITNNYALLDTLEVLGNKYNYEQIQPTLKEYQMIAYLKIADDLYNSKKPKAGEEYLNLFENECPTPIDSYNLSYWTEKTYSSIAVYYLNKHNKPTASIFINEGLKYVPTSELLKSLSRSQAYYN